MVDPSLLRQANDRGVTIAFADLDGADGLWVPEERTVLVSRKLTEAEVARVIEHELTHVMIDDQHADLDAGKDVLVGHPPAPSRRWAAVALTAAALAAVIGGVTYGLAKATGGPSNEQVAPTLPGLTASESAPPGMIVVPSRGPDGRIVYVTVTASAPAAPAPSATPSPAESLTISPSATVPVPGRPSTTAPRGGQATVSPSPVPPPVTTVPPTVPPTTDPPATTEPPPTTPAATDPGAGAGDAGAGTGDAGTGDAGAGDSPGDTADQPGAAGASDVLVAGSGDGTPVVAPTG